MLASKGIVPRHWPSGPAILPRYLKHARRTSANPVGYAPWILYPSRPVRDSEVTDELAPEDYVS